jgi:hypothetical protein
MKEEGVIIDNSFDVSSGIKVLVDIDLIEEDRSKI